VTDEQRGNLAFLRRRYKNPPPAQKIPPSVELRALQTQRITLQRGCVFHL
jgi:hypothetical protein